MDAPSLSVQPKSDVSDFGQFIKWPNSDKFEFGCKRERGRRGPSFHNIRDVCARRCPELRLNTAHSRQPECSATMPPAMGWNETRAKPAVRIISANVSGRGKRRIDSTR